MQQPHDHMFPDESDDYLNNWQTATPENWAQQYERQQKQYWEQVYNRNKYNNSIFGY